MELIENSKLQIRAQYDYELCQNNGKIYSKVENPNTLTYIGEISSNYFSHIDLYIRPEFQHKSYIIEELEKLKPKFIEYGNFLKARKNAEKNYY